MGCSEGRHSRADTSTGSHYPCSMSAVLIGEMHDFGGPDAVARLMELSGSERSVAYLTDIGNWISYDEALALWRAGMEVTHNPQFPRVLGQRAAERLASSPVAAALRSLGSPGKVYEQVAISATKFSTVVRMEAVEMGEHTAVLTCEPVEGFSRAPEHCAWTVGLLAASPILFGLEHAQVEHDECAALGAERCVYRINWSGEPQRGGEEGQELDVLRRQFDGLQERFNSLFAAASDLIAADEISDILARLTERAALEVRAPRYLLAVRLASGEVHIHQRGFDEAELSGNIDRLLDEGQTEFPRSWLVVPVRSDRRSYGRLVAAFETETSFFPQERDLLEIFARYAASALDGAAALTEAQRRYDETSALLALSKALASAGTSTEVAQRLGEAVPLVVDCDRVSVFLWDPGSQELVRRNLTSRDPEDPLLSQPWVRSPTCWPRLSRSQSSWTPKTATPCSRRRCWATATTQPSSCRSPPRMRFWDCWPSRCLRGGNGWPRLRICSTACPVWPLRPPPRCKTAGWWIKSPTRQCMISSPDWPTGSSSPRSCAEPSTGPAGPRSW